VLYQRQRLAVEALHFLELSIAVVVILWQCESVVKYLGLAFRERAAVQLGFSFLVKFSVALRHGLPHCVLRPPPWD